jgi:hypothetical protein
MSRSVLAGDLAQNHVVALWRRNYQRRPPLTAIGEREADDYAVALYKSRNARRSQ